jgi:peptidoglycan/xylan/chitin deacetylase (PgdA/CDA1 family)
MTSSLRWQLKKTARKSMALSYWAANRITVAKSSSIPSIRVLTYHRFGEIPRDPFCVRPQDFAFQMEWLVERGLAVSLDQVESFVHRGSKIKSGSVLVTIDDGCLSVKTHALPILKRLGIPAVVFVSSGNVGRRSNETNQQGELPQEDYMDWCELQELLNAGIAIGSHAVTHRSLGRVSIAEAADEVMRSRLDLERELGNQITSFAYPYGTLADFNDEVCSVLKRVGYRSAFTSQHGAIYAGMDAMLLPRIKVEGSEGNWLFPLLAQGGLDAWRWIDRMLWRFQASGRG